MRIVRKLDGLGKERYDVRRGARGLVAPPARRTEVSSTPRRTNCVGAGGQFSLLTHHGESSPVLICGAAASLCLW